MKVIIVGGVAGGASCAARLRRLDEKVEIIMVEKGPYVSYANCGLPYHIGGVIEKESSLLVATEEMFRAVFGIDCRTNCEAVSIDAKNKTVDLRNTMSGEVTTESYDKLVLSPGAPSIRPPLPGIDLPGVFEVRTVPDTRAVVEWVEKGTDFLAGMSCYTGIQQAKPTTRAVVVGGGFIGLECAENLVHRGFDVTLIQKPDHVLTPLDPEIGSLVQGHIKRHGVKVVANDGVNGFKQLEGGAIEVQTENGKSFPADVVILAIGVRPETTLAKTAGITIGERRGILVDDQMHTSDPDIFAVGDAIEVEGFHDRRTEPDRSGGSGEPPGTHRGGCHLRARLALPRHPGAPPSSACSAARRRGPGFLKRPSSASEIPITKRFICSRTRTPATTPARR